MVPYETLKEGYRRLTDHVKEKGLDVVVPSREVYLKGPGMLFKGNERKYRTEIQFFVNTT